DNTRTAVTKPNYYEPEVNITYQEMASHYGTVILPARPRKPRDYHEDFVIPKKQLTPAAFLRCFIKCSG
ncbi:MAG: hypothetical protein ABFD82_18545, partial [Syntrophaceae bacterium]